MRIHELKSWPEVFEPVMCGRKTHEVRKNDRSFEVGDLLFLREWIPDKQEYTGRLAFALVDYVTADGTFGLPADLCVMSIKLQTYAY